MFIIFIQQYLSMRSNDDDLSEYQKKYEPLIVKVNSNSISLSNSDIICRRCQVALNHKQYSLHSKNCKRNSDKIMSRQHELTMSKPTDEMQEQRRQPKTSDEFYENLLASVLSFIKTGVSELLSRTKYLKRGSVLQILGKKCIRFAAQIPEIIDENDYKFLVDNDKFMCEALKNINDVFNPTLVESRIAHFGEIRKTKIRRKLNKYLQKLEIGPLYVVEKIIYKTERQKNPLMFRELSSFFLQLIATKQKKHIHLALDLLIIFHSMQRFPSSIQIVTQKVLEIMQKFPKNKLIYARISVTTKTQQEVNMYLNKNLINWLIEFGWTGFSFNSRFYERFTEKFNFSMYSLRRGAITQAQIFLNQPDPTVLTNHRSKRNAYTYLTNLTTFDNKQFHEYLQIESDDKLKVKYLRYECLDRIQPKMKSSFTQKEQFFELRAFKQQKQMKMVEEQQINNSVLNTLNEEQMEKEESEDSLSDQVDDDEDEQQILIDGMQFKLKAGLFSDKVFLQSIKKGRCYQCKTGSAQYICVFCLKNFHLDCLSDFCYCMKMNKRSFGVTCLKSKSILQNFIIMPDSYFNKNSANLDSVRKFIHMRGFYFTTVAILQTSQSLNSEVSNCSQIKLSRFSQYEAGQYFPPLVLGISGDENPNGTGVGLFCSEDIRQNVFIGEYGGDIVSEDEMIFIKRRDMSMKLTQIQDISYYVGSVKHCSYVQLINSSKEKANCQIMLAVTNNKLKLLLYTKKNIQKGSELLYYYGDGFDLKYTKKLRKQLLISDFKMPKNQIQEKDLNENILQFQQQSQNSLIIDQNPFIQNPLQFFHQADKKQENVEENCFRNSAEVPISQKIIQLPLIEKQKNETQSRQIGIQKLKVPIFNYKLQANRKSKVEQNKKTKEKQQKKRKRIKMMEKINIIRCVNSCYADATIVVLKMLSDYFPSDTKKITRDILSSRSFEIEKLVTNFEKKRKNQKNIQQDFDQFFVYVNNLLDTDSPFYQIIILEKFQCKTCNFQTQKYAYEGEYRMHLLKIRFQDTYELEKICLSCSINTSHIIQKSLVSSPDLVIIKFDGTMYDLTKRKNEVELRKIKHEQVLYEPKLAVFHQGDQTHSGHFVAFDIKSGIVYDSGTLRKFNHQYDNHTCLVVMEKMRIETQQKVSIDEELKNSGVFVKAGERTIVSHNIKVYFNIASIVKIITFLTCEKLLKRFGIDSTHRFQIPEYSHLLGSVAGLKVGSNYTINELYHWMLICSACEAAYALSLGFGAMLREGADQDTKKYKDEKIFLFQMRKLAFELLLLNTLLEDACGLHRNISCVEDLLTLIQKVFLNPTFVQICKKPMCEEFSNTNIFCQKIIGKTGTHVGGVCFVGKNTQQIIVALNFQSKNTLQYFMSKWLKQK